MWRAVFLAGLGCFLAFELQGQVLSPDATAKCLAGLPSGVPQTASMEASADWREHASAMDSACAALGRRLDRIQEWSRTAVPRCSTVFYPFSGPDYLYVRAIYPDASTYVLCGLEPVGAMPDLSRIKPRSLGKLRQSLGTLVNAGYFVTKDMASQLNGQDLNGTLPILYVLLARSDSRIVSVSRDRSHVQIDFIEPGGTGHRSLHYYCMDLSGAKGGTLIARHGVGGVYIKSASYLLHRESFSGLREALLSRCKVVVQDDSGIPFRCFDRVRWDLRPYGRYTAPLSIFEGRYQADLAEFYAKNTAGELGFGAGYKWNPREAGLLVGIRY